MKTNAGIDFFFKSIMETNRNIEIDEEYCTY